eukprot:m51a1_g1501 putative oligopeptidase (602) ;mRNA; f:352628-355019
MSGAESASVKSRAEVPEEHRWNMALLFASDAAWEAAFAALPSLVAPVEALRGRVTSGPEALRDAVIASDALEREVDRLRTYASHRSDEDTANTFYMGMKDRAQTAATECESRTSWLLPEIFAADEERLRSLVAAEVMAPYRRKMEQLLRDKPHTLSEAEELLLSRSSDALECAYKAFEMLTDADLRFGTVKNEAGEDVELTEGNYITFLMSYNRDVRKRAFEALYDGYAKVKNTLAATLDGQVRKQVFLARARKHKSALEASLHEDAVPPVIYDTLISAVHEALPAMYKYLALRKRCLGLEKLDMYDQHVPIVPDFKVEFPWPEAKRLVRESLSVLGPRYVAIIDEAFANRWIDIYENRGKRSGAYSGGCYDSPPYVLLNFTPDNHGLFTLAHELGHSAHTYLSNKSQPHMYAAYRIFVAEVASITNEGLLLHHLLQTTADKRLKAYLLNHLCNEYRTTVYRQTMFAEFEKLVHERVESGNALTQEDACGIYGRLNDLYYGPDVVADRRIALEWSRIPHFYYDFYVYKYSTSFAVSQKVVKDITSGVPGAVEHYLEFLSSGCTKDPLDLLAGIGVDLRKPDAIVDALGDFSDKVDQLSALL